MLNVQSTALRISTIWKFVLIITMRWKNFNQAVAYIFCRLLYVFVCKLQSQVILVFCKINNKDSKVICSFSKLTLKPMLKKFCTHCDGHVFVINIVNKSMIFFTTWLVLGSGIIQGALYFYWSQSIYTVFVRRLYADLRSLNLVSIVYSSERLKCLHTLSPEFRASLNSGGNI